MVTAVANSLLNSALRRDTIGQPPNVFYGLLAAAQRYTLHSDSTLVLGASDRQVFGVDVDRTREVRERILCIAVRLLESKVDVGRVSSPRCFLPF
jgi:hypothetical protein